MTRSNARTFFVKVLIAASSIILMAMLSATTAIRGDAVQALYEPEDGRIYHGTAPNPTVVDGYIAALDDEAIAPLIEGIHLGASGTSGRQYVVDTIRDWLTYVHEAGRIPHLSLSMRTGTGEPSDVEIATTTLHDRVLHEIGKTVAEFGKPLFIRLGFEFNGVWNGYTSGVYPIAYRKMVDIFRAAGVDQAAYIWCYEPDGPNDFDAVIDGQSAWYPGDDYVDWFGLDLFKAEHFVPPMTERDSQNAAYSRSIRFLEMASTHAIRDRSSQGLCHSRRRGPRPC
jgi:Glycosyl hydrolase family 26